MQVSGVTSKHLSISIKLLRTECALGACCFPRAYSTLTPKVEEAERPGARRLCAHALLLVRCWRRVSGNAYEEDKYVGEKIAGGPGDPEQGKNPRAGRASRRNGFGLDRFPGIGEIPENGSTFAENALVKAGTVADYTGLISVADDSGLEVDALGGRPGIYSARYSDDWLSNPGETKDQRNIRKLLYELKDVPYERRQARFVCCMAAVKPGHYEPEDTLVVQGTWEGRILNEAIGENGFGYDPVFCDIIMGVTAAQMSAEDKMARSHRGNALRSLVACWQDWISTPPVH